MIYAHSRNHHGNRHLLVDHLCAVADMAASHASAFGAGEAARMLGLWHDAGKFSPAFQQYLLDAEAGLKRRGPDHKAAGAQLAAGSLGAAAMLIQGHHGGLRDPQSLREWLGRHVSDPELAATLQLAQRAVPEMQVEATIPLPSFMERDSLTAELFLRILFSCLVDADFLDTERHFGGGESAARSWGTPLEVLWGRFLHAQAALTGHREDAVGRARHEIYQSCLAAAELPPGLFRLTVPTGGGKTRSAMGFALRHALEHGQRRIIVAVPFITITEQTADDYRKIFERDSENYPIVLEHHSGVAAEEADEYTPDAIWRRLASENWDAPIVVTTTVQLFESLFASQTSRCRKLHNLTRSIIILDEAQALPSRLLDPILHALRELSAHYGTTVVLSTATQPAFESIRSFRDVRATEIVPEPARFFESLRRVEYEWLTDPPLSWEEVADIMRSEPQAMAVMNTKADAIALLDSMGDPEALHLSTLLCGAHRREVLCEVRRRLRAGLPCRLVSTQVVEAGVDLDFPMVVRAIGPLDGIIQAAGRCNREGRLARGRVVVFRPANGGVPPGAYRAGVGVTGAMLGAGNFDPGDPATAHTYFQRLFSAVDTDSAGIQKLRSRLDYSEVSARFKMIDDATESVLVTSYGSEQERRAVSDLIESLLAAPENARRTLRRLQPYLVSVWSRKAEKYRSRGLIHPLLPGLGEWLGSYDPIRGLTGEDPEPDSLVV